MSSVSSKTNTRKLKVYIGKYNMPTLIYSKDVTAISRKKVLVFDLDETLGSFSELFEIWSLLFPETVDVVQSEAIQILKREVFLHLLDLYPEFFRPHIFQVLKYIYSKIVSGECECVYLYTNNQCTHPEWVELLMHYITTKLAIPSSPPLFARPICAFKINERVIEHNRTSHAKTHDDFIACTLLPRNVEICYIDDKFYSKMVHDKVYYIQPPPYYHPLPYSTIYDRFINSDVVAIMQKHHIMKQSPQYPFGKRILNLPRVMSDLENHHIYTKMMYYLKEFFILTTRKPRTRKHMPLHKRYTKRRVHSRQRSI